MRISVTVMGVQLSDSMKIIDTLPQPESQDQVQLASEESFPASDPPSRSVVTGIGGPIRKSEMLETELDSHVKGVAR
jgi:hypothetical protein